MSIAELHTFLEDAFETRRPYLIESLEADRLRMVMPEDKIELRPGGTVSGPTLMMLADAATYALVLSRIGPVPLAVTSSLHITFLNRPAPGRVLADARMLKLGRKLAVAEVLIHTDAESLGPVEEPDVVGTDISGGAVGLQGLSATFVAQATVTYAIPASAWSG
jgi:uncharacterized protein (TIGR00369 family)